MNLRTRQRWLSAGLCLALGTLHHAPVRAAELLLIPGTGQQVLQVSDDFENPDWKYIPNNPKSSKDLDEQVRVPAGISQNGRWYEGAKRGHPDVVRRVPTPPGGLPGSTGSLLLQSLNTGIPGRPSFHLQQDDFIADVHYRLGGSIPVSQSPNVVTRVFLPPVDQWENRSGPQFAFRAAVDTTVTKSTGGFFSSSRVERKTYWPGMFIEFQSKRNAQENDYASIRVRANSRGMDYKALQITQTGWWTLGMSFTPDGRVHYFAHPGVEDLRPEDHIASEYPYGYRCERFKTFFYNVCSGDDGRTWSTAWIIDDPRLYYVQPGSLAAQPSAGSAAKNR